MLSLARAGPKRFLWMPRNVDNLLSTLFVAFNDLERADFMAIN
jgi:hypothetical protein